MFLLDTCAVLWFANGDRLRAPAAGELPAALARGERLAVSPISAWEIAMLVSKGRVALAMNPDAWFERFLAGPGAVPAPMPPRVLMASVALPGDPVGDPADRIVIATAREYGYTLVTRDRRILDYGARGHVGVMGC